MFTLHLENKVLRLLKSKDKIHVEGRVLIIFHSSRLLNCELTQLRTIKTEAYEKNVTFQVKAHIITNFPTKGLRSTRRGSVYIFH